MTLFIAAIGLALAIEGLAYAIAPRAMKRFAAMVAGSDENGLRQSGIIAGALGAIIIYAVSRFM